MNTLSMLWAVVLKELRQTVRDKRMMALLVAAPLVQLVMFGSAVQLDVDQVPTALVQQDHSAAAREHARRVYSDGTLARTRTPRSADDALRMLETGEAAAVLFIPPDFARDQARAQRPRLQMVLDGSDPNRANVAANAVAMHLQNESVRAPRLGVESRVLFNPGLSTSIYMVPGVSAMLLLLVTTVVSSMGLARERERGTLEQIQVTPLPGLLLVLGKIIPFAAIGLLDFVLAMVVGAYGFEMPIRGSFALLLLATAIYLVNTLGAGLLIASLSASQQQAFMGGFLFMLPAALLSGIMTPVRSMPSWLSPLTVFNPLRHYAEILRAVLLRGAGASELAFQLSTLAVLGLVICCFAGASFRRQQG
ncbi:MAG TPA: ABC transporter permease [Polyangiales bacterium]